MVEIFPAKLDDQSDRYVPQPQEKVVFRLNELQASEIADLQINKSLKEYDLEEDLFKNDQNVFMGKNNVSFGEG